MESGDASHRFATPVAADRLKVETRLNQPSSELPTLMAVRVVALREFKTNIIILLIYASIVHQMHISSCNILCAGFFKYKYLPFH
jgi:hypothetical protein